MAETAYCVQNDIDNEIGAAARAALTDDSPPSTLRDAIAQGGSIIDDYLLSQYDPPTLAATSSWIVQKARVICAYCLFECRGVPAPPGLAQKYEQVLKVLERIRKGLAQVPDCSPRSAPIPVLSNVRVRLDPFPRAVVERGISTGNPSGYSQNTDQTEAGFTYSI